MSATAQQLLVVNQRDHDVSVVDPAAGREVARIAEGVAGQWAHEVAVSADGRTAFLPVYGDSGVGRPGVDGREMLLVDLASRKVTGRVDFGHGVRPHDAVLSPDGALLYVTTELDHSVTIVDTNTHKVTGAIPTGQAESHMLALSRDGRRGYTANVGPGTVSVLDMVGRKTVAVIPVARTVQRISISSDSRLVFTSDQEKPRLAVIDTVTNTVKSWVPLPGTGYGSAATEDGRSLLVAVPGKNQVAVVDLKTMQVAHTIDVPSTPQEVLIRPDGKTAYVSCNESGKVAVLDLLQWKVEKVIAAGGLADGLGWVK